MGFIFTNGRFLEACSPIGLIFVVSFIFHRLNDNTLLKYKHTTGRLFSVGLILLFALLNAETWIHAINSHTNPEQARWIAQMSLSLVWGLYATALLILGFRCRLRPARLCALGLFGLTALKLVLVDMAKVQEVYRILSFVALGLLMILASYLYHRAEKRISALHT